MNEIGLDEGFYLLHVSDRYNLNKYGVWKIQY